MKGNEYVQGKRGKEHLAITAELLDVLREVNLNSSWKTGSSKFSKTKTGCMRPESKYSNIMTEQDLDRLFNKSKEKVKLRTEAVAVDCSLSQPEAPRCRDFTAIRFLHLDDDYDKMLTGLPVRCNEKENMKGGGRDEADLTVKFKKDYIVGKVIGEGAYASVRVAVYKPENRKIAIKAYEKGKIKEAQRKKTVKREIKILQLVDHPNIVKIYDVVETNNHVNIIMEYLPGISLGTSLKQQSSQRFPEPAAKTIIRELAAALKYLHARNIAHRDIKLENVILDEQQSPKLIDFGFSTCIERNKKVRMALGR
jgi:tRNA A-37 threonylcarbamoyl transferase component Bud32